MEPARLTELFSRDLEGLAGHRRRLTLHFHPTEALALSCLLRMAERHPWCTGSLADFAGDLARRCQSASVATLALRTGLDLAFPRRDGEWPASDARRWPAHPEARAIQSEPWQPVKVPWSGRTSPEVAEKLKRRRDRLARATSIAHQDGETAGALGWPSDGNPYDPVNENTIWFHWYSGWKLGNDYYLRGVEKEPLWP